MESSVLYLQSQGFVALTKRKGESHEYSETCLRCHFQSSDGLVPGTLLKLAFEPCSSFGHFPMQTNKVMLLDEGLAKVLSLQKVAEGLRRVVGMRQLLHYGLVARRLNQPRKSHPRRMGHADMLGRVNDGTETTLGTQELRKMGSRSRVQGSLDFHYRLIGDSTAAGCGPAFALDTFQKKYASKDLYCSSSELRGPVTLVAIIFMQKYRVLGWEESQCHFQDVDVICAWSLGGEVNKANSA